jgi:predicted nuclease with TOPRIM domain
MIIRRSTYEELVADRKKLLEMNTELLAEMRSINELNKQVNSNNAEILKECERLLDDNKTLAKSVKELGALCKIYKKRLEESTNETVD